MGYLQLPFSMYFWESTIGQRQKSLILLRRNQIDWKLEGIKRMWSNCLKIKTRSHKHNQIAWKWKEDHTDMIILLEDKKNVSFELVYNILKWQKLNIFHKG